MKGRESSGVTKMGFPGAGAAGAGGSRGGVEGSAFRPMDGHGDKPSAAIQAAYLNEFNLIPGLQRNNGQNITHPGARAILDNGVYVDQSTMLRQADQWLKTDADMGRVAGGFMKEILQGLGDVGKGFAGAQGDQTTPEEYDRLAKEQQQRQADEEAARLAEEQRQQAQANA